MSFSEFSSSSFVSITTFVDKERCLFVLSRARNKEIESKSTWEIESRTHVYKTWRYQHCWSWTCVIFKLRSGPRSPQSLCGSVVEHQSAESEGLRFDSSRGLQSFFFVPRSWHLYLSVYRAKELQCFLYLCCFYVGVRFLFGIFRKKFLIKTHQSAPRKRGLEWNKTFGR